MKPGDKIEYNMTDFSDKERGSTRRWVPAICREIHDATVLIELDNGTLTTVTKSLVRKRK